MLAIYRKFLNTSPVFNTGRASNTSQGFDLIVLEAGPQIDLQAWFHDSI